jgi:hypothetical protein
MKFASMACGSAALLTTAVAAATSPLDQLTITGDMGCFSRLFFTTSSPEDEDLTTINAGPWGFTRYLHARVASASGASVADSMASATASVSADALSINGFCKTSVVNGGSALAGFAAAGINFTCNITIPADQPFTWSFGPSTFTGANSYVRLRQNGTTLFDSSIDDGDWSNNSGPMTPGSYTLQVYIQASSDLLANGGKPDRSDFNFTLFILGCPCAADFDGSGGTPDINDIDAFFADWLVGSASADTDCSGGTPDSADVDAFFSDWLSGGC